MNLTNSLGLCRFVLYMFSIHITWHDAFSTTRSCDTPDLWVEAMPLILYSKLIIDVTVAVYNHHVVLLLDFFTPSPSRSVSNCSPKMASSTMHWKTARRVFIHAFSTHMLTLRMWWAMLLGQSHWRHDRCAHARGVCYDQIYSGMGIWIWKHDQWLNLEAQACEDHDYISSIIYI